MRISPQFGASSRNLLMLFNFHVKFLEDAPNQGEIRIEQNRRIQNRIESKNNKVTLNIKYYLMNDMQWNFGRVLEIKFFRSERPGYGSFSRSIKI